MAPRGVIANVGVRGAKVDRRLEAPLSRNITITTRLMDAVSTPMLLKTVQAGTIDLMRLITHPFSLDQIVEAYEAFGDAARTHALKVIISA